MGLSLMAGGNSFTAAALPPAKPMKLTTSAEMSGFIMKLMNVAAPAGFGESAGITILSINTGTDPAGGANAIETREVNIRTGNIDSALDGSYADHDAAKAAGVAWLRQQSLRQ
jgi:hypothetical protein